MLTLFKGFDRAIWIRFWGATLLNIGNFMIYPFLALYLTKNLGVALGIVGWVLMVRPVGSFLGGMLGGYYADKIGRKPVMIGGMLVTGLAILGYAFTENVLWFGALSFLQGLSDSFARPATSAMIADVTDESNRARAYSLLYMGMNVGTAVGPVLAVSLVLQHPQLLFSILAALHALYCAVVWLFIPETKPDNMACQSEECRRSQGHIGYSFILRDLKLMLFILAGFSISVGTYQLDTLLPLHLDDVLPGTLWLYGMLHSLNGLMVVFLALPIAGLMSRFPSYSVAKLGAALYALGMLVLAVNASVALMILGFFLFTLGEMTLSSVSQKILADFAPDDMRARYMSASSISWVLASLIGPVAGSQLMNHFGGHLMLLVFALLMASAVLTYRLLHLRRLKDLANEQNQAEGKGPRPGAPRPLPH